MAKIVNTNYENLYFIFIAKLFCTQWVDFLWTFPFTTDNEIKTRKIYEVLVIALNVVGNFVVKYFKARRGKHLKRQSFLFFVYQLIFWKLMFKTVINKTKGYQNINKQSTTDLFGCQYDNGEGHVRPHGPLVGYATGRRYKVPYY